MIKEINDKQIVVYPKGTALHFVNTKNINYVAKEPKNYISLVYVKGFAEDDDIIQVHHRIKIQNTVLVAPGQWTGDVIEFCLIGLFQPSEKMDEELIQKFIETASLRSVWPQVKEHASYLLEAISKPIAVKLTTVNLDQLLVDVKAKGQMFFNNTSI